MPLASAAAASATTHHMSNSRSMLSGSSTGMAHSNSSLLNGGAGAGNISPATPLSPRAKMRSTSNSQPIKYNHNFSAIPLSNESSSVSTIKLNDSYSNNNNSHHQNNGGGSMASVIPSSNYSLNTNAKIKSNGMPPHHMTVGMVGAVLNTNSNNSSEADSGRASMASNIDQDQCSPTFQQRAFILNRCK